MIGGRRVLAGLIAVFVATTVASCRTPRSQVLVVVTLDPVDPPRERIDSVHLTIRSPAQPDPPRGDHTFVIGNEPGQTSFPFSFGVYPQNEAVERRAEVVVEACGADGCTRPVVTARANVGFVRGETRVLTLRLTHRCEGAQCPAGQTCHPDTGLCVDSTVDAASLPIDGADASIVPDAATHPQVVQVAAGGGATCVRMTDRTVRCAGGADSLVRYSNFPGATATSALVEVPEVRGAVDIAVGYGHACAIMPDRSVMCWGANQYGQIGDGTVSPSSPPVVITRLHDVAQISLGGFFGCARLFDGTVSCWGLDQQGELGEGPPSSQFSRSTPHPVPGLDHVVEIAAGGFHACARLDSGSVKCWGARFSPAIGDGGPFGAGNDPTAPISVFGIDDATQITAGGLHTCVRRANGDVACWGTTSFGQAGTGSATASIPTRVDIANVVEVRAGAYHTCARLVDGDVNCWGRNDRGQIGDGTRTDRHLPVPVIGIGDAIAISVGTEHSCAQRADRSVVCWGDDSTGQLASGRALTQPLPVDAVALNGVDRVNAGSLHSCAVRDRSAWCWGMSVGAGVVEGITERVQDGPRSSNATPSPVVHLAPPPDQVTVGNDFACAHMVDGTVRCWGHNHLGQLGSGTIDSVTPVEVDDLVNTAEVRAGVTFACARGLDGTVSCWGDNSAGTLGVSRLTQSRARALPIPGITNATHLSTHDFHACARLANGTVSCWGANFVGQVGNSSFGDQPVDAPLAAVDITNAIDVGTAEISSYARTADGGMYVWGWNGVGLLLPDPSTLLVANPRLSILRDVATFTSGNESACVVSNAGELSCWGINAWGEVGDGTRFVSNEPHRIRVGSSDAEVTGVSMASLSTCAIASGEVYCWGENAAGTVGDGSGRLRTSPVHVDGVSNATAVAGAIAQHCAVTRSHDVRCWGTDLFGSLGDERRDDPGTAVDVAHLEGVRITRVSTGVISACALDDTGGVWCWGANDVGELGAGDDPTNGDGTAPVRVLVPVGATVTDIAVGYRFACALAAGQVYCWGANEYGQLGDGTNIDRATPRAVPGITDATRLVATSTSVCVRRGVENSVWCWGGNSFGQLGIGTIAPSPTPVAVPALANVTQLEAGGDFVCALHDDGRVGCWGENRSQELGPHGPNGPYSVDLVDVPVGADVSRIVLGYSHACVVYRDAGRRAQCWGDNSSNQIAPGSGAPIRAPIDVTQASNADDLALGFGHTCALRHGHVTCWGRNDGHELGDDTNRSSVLPRDVIGSTDDVERIDSSNAFTCAVRSSGGIRCWGSNETGALGNGTRAASLSPVSVRGLQREGYGVASITGGAGYSCARLGNDTMRCWGSNFSGQLGETVGADHNVPSAGATVGNLPNVTHASTGLSHACAISDGTAYCWGSNDHGQLGSATDGDASAIPLPVALPGVEDIAAGGEHTCALVRGGAVVCWGANDRGQVGVAPSQREGITMVPGVTGVEHIVAGGALSCAWSSAGVTCWGDGHTPRHFDELDHVSRVATGTDVGCDLDPRRYIGCASTGRDHTCVLRNGEVWCFGTNAHGEIGDGTFVDAMTPVRVHGLTDVTDIAVGGRHSCARRSDGSVVCWGADSYGQLGTGRESWRAVPAGLVGLP